MIMGRILFFFLSIIALAQANPSTEKQTKPLVLQKEVSHPRNTDQISFIFRENKVEMVTNIATYQKGKKPRLGWFESSMTPLQRSLKKRLKRYQGWLKKTVPLSSLIKDRRVQPLHIPHAPILRLNTREIKEGGPFFKELEDIIQQIKKKQWICVECVTYQRHKKGIFRVVRKRTGISHKKRDNQSKQPAKKIYHYLVQRKILSKKSLNCIRKTKSRWECVDKQFGIFEI